LIERLERVSASEKRNKLDSEFESKAKELLSYFDKQFGVNDFFEAP